MQTHAQCIPCTKPLERFLKTAPTPLFLYDEKSLVQAAQALFRAFSGSGGFLLRFPVRMNPNPAVLRLLHSCGCGVLCRSRAELELAAQCGFSGGQIAYEPLLRCAEAEETAHALGAVFVLDGADLLPERLPESATLLLRQQGPLRFDGRAVTGVPAAFAGMERGELLRLAECLHANGVSRLGLGMRLGDLCMDGDFYPAIFAQLAALAQELYEKTGIAAEALDLGGGFGISYRPGFPGPEPEACAGAIRTQIQALPEALRGLSLQMSPGRFLTAPCGTLVTRVRAVKPGAPPLVVLDADPAQCPRLSKSGAYHPVSVLHAAGRRMQMQLLTGSSQESLPMRRLLPELRPGDPVLIGMLGADGRSLASCYGGAELCPEYLVRADGKIEPVTAC